MKPFLRIAVFCTEAEYDTTGQFKIEGILDIDTVKVDGTERAIERSRRLVIHVELADDEPHAFRFRWIDEQAQPLSDWTSTTGRRAPRSTGWTYRGAAPLLRLAPPREGHFRFLVDCDGEVIGWIPLQVRLLKTKGGS